VTVHQTLLPDLNRTDVGLVVVGEWALPAPERQRAAADAAILAWDSVPWPPGLLSHSVLLGTDGGTVLHYQQWSGEHACREFVGTARRAWVRVVDDAVAGIDRRGVVGYLPPRSHVFATNQVPGCIVVISREFVGPDLARARRWVEAMFDVPGGVAPQRGLLSAHLHVSTDGARALNYAQWTTEDAHRELVDSTPDRIAESPPMRQVETWPGLTRTTVVRYHPHRSVAAPANA
jgi:hypothetical protein